MSRFRTFGALLCFLASSGGRVSAQGVPTINPSGEGAAPAPSQGVDTPPAGMPGAPTPGGETAAPAGGFYYTEPVGEEEKQAENENAGPVPEMHVVKEGDTLWELCDLYFRNPWEWPRIWSYNPTITNPHWIYPGDLVRLLPETIATQASAPRPPASVALLEGTAASGSRTVELRQIAFVTLEDLRWAGSIAGSPEEKIMLAQGDEVYLDYPEGRPPQVGRRYAAYSLTKEVVHPQTKKKVGAFVLLRGEIEVREVKKGKHARGIITYSNEVMQRGDRVGNPKTQFKQVAPVTADVDVEGVIVETLGTDEIAGAGQLVFIDRGTAAGIKVGNRMYVVRRGDAYNVNMGPKANAGRDDRRFPEKAIAELRIVEVDDTSAVGVISFSTHESEIGDHVVMRKGK
ncbi:MAG: LysM peptidoglycan-binding domain-containing protein [Deltaproteobacteria bacterium]|nr:LysM peptidoglycan-binding domain-containing protein [Deltaproteobacteria bacterium]